MNPENTCLAVQYLPNHSNYDLWCWYKNPSTNGVWWFGDGMDGGARGWIHKNDWWPNTIPDYQQRPALKC